MTVVPRRLLAALAVAALPLSLAACAPTPTDPQAGAPTPTAAVSAPAADPTGAPAVALAPAAERGYGTAKVVQDLRAQSVTIVPKQRNGALVVHVHGWGQTRWSLLRRPGQSRVAHALADAGFTVLSADARLKAWGDPASVGVYRTLIEQAQRRYHLRDVFLMGESMGGLATMQLARQLSSVRAVTAWYPVCDLRTMQQRSFHDSITSAWRGLDRAAVSPVRVGDTPMLVWASPRDTVVNAAKNAAQCVAAATRAGADVRYYHSTGQHGDWSNFQPSTVVRFFEQYRTVAA